MTISDYKIKNTGIIKANSADLLKIVHASHLAKTFKDMPNGFKNFNEPKYYVKNTGLSSRVLSSWVDGNVIEETKPYDKGGWRKFSAVEIACITLLKELRDKGLSLDALKKIKVALNEPVNEAGEEKVCLIAFALLYAVSKDFGRNIYFCTFDGSSSFLGLTDDINAFKNSNKANASYIQINLNKLWEGSIDEVVIYEEYETLLSKEEYEAFQILRKASTAAVTITKQEQKVQYIEETKQMTGNLKVLEEALSGLSEYFGGVNFGKFSFDIHEGKISNFKRTTSKKVR